MEQRAGMPISGNGRAGQTRDRKLGELFFDMFEFSISHGLRWLGNLFLFYVHDKLKEVETMKWKKVEGEE